MNQVTLIGRIGRDIEIKTTASGLSIANISVATDGWEARPDGGQKSTDWHRVTVFGKDAERMVQYMHKGSPIALSGRLKTREYQDKAGATQRITEVICERWEFVPSASRDGGSGAPAGNSGAQGGYSAPKAASEGQYRPERQDDFSDDIPF